MADRTDLFVSYKAEDRARVAPLVAALEAEGFTVWWDAHIAGGANWQEDIERHLDSAKCVLVVWSRRSVGPEGHFVRDEARRAQRRGAYLPVCIDPVDPPLGFGEVQALRLKGWKRDRSDARFRTLADAVREQISGNRVSRPHVHMRQPHVSRRAAIGGGVAIAGLAAAGAGWLLFEGSPNTDRIAVLPFKNLSGDPNQAYFAEGIAEELRGALSRIGLEVIGSASSEAVKDLDTRTAASKLGVGKILAGSVRRSPGLVRITAQLVGGSDGVEQWSQTYDRSPGDAIEIETDIATNVAQALSVALGQHVRAALTLGGTADASAQDLYLKALDRFHSKSGADSLAAAVNLVDAAIARDPKYADAYVLKARTLEQFAATGADSTADRDNKVAQAEAAARRAIDIAPELGSAYAVLALISADHLNFTSAAQQNERALALSPGDLGVLSIATALERTLADRHKALEIADRLIKLDPLQPSGYTRRAEALYCLRQYPQAIEAFRKVLELAPQMFIANYETGSCLALMGRLREAKAEYGKIPADSTPRLTGEGIVAARSGDRAEADRRIARMRELFGASPSFQYAEIYAQAGDANRAFGELENAVRAQDPGLIDLNVDPFLDPIRRDARFAALLKRLNFPTLT